MCSIREIQSSKSADAEEEMLCDAGSDLLTHYQVQWSELHHATVEAASVAEEVDRLCFTVNKSILKRQSVVYELESVLKTLPEVESSMERITEDLTETIICLEKLEQAIHMREESIFQTEMRKRFDSQYVLKIHEEKLNREFEKIAVSLESDHVKRIRDLRRSEENAIREKQELYRRAFEKDLMEYKDGKVRRPDDSAIKSDVTLEQIHVEPDEDDRLCLEQFLSDSADHSEQ